MSWFIHNDAFGLGDDQESSNYYSSTLRRHHAQPVANSSGSELNWIGERPRESYMPTGLAPATSSWTGTTFAGPPFSSSVHSASVWPGSPRLDGAPYGPPFGAPRVYADGMGTNFPVGFGVAPPMLEQALPVMQSALPASQPRPLDWAHAPGPPVLPVRSAMQNANGVHSSIGMRPEIPRIPLTASSLGTGHSERRDMPTGRLPPTATPHSVRPLTQRDPVLVAPFTSRPRGERWDLFDPPLTLPTFPCLWASGGTQCTALIAGDRRSVTGHLRDAHNFSCDDLPIVCAWDLCKTSMQRRNVPRHIITRHMEIKVTCERCGMELSRADANRKHQLACTGST